MEKLIIDFTERAGFPTWMIYAILAILAVIFLWPKLRDIGIDIGKLVKRWKPAPKTQQPRVPADNGQAESPPPTITPTPATTLATTKAPTDGAIFLALLAVNSPYIFIQCSKHPTQDVPNLFEPIFFSVWCAGALTAFSKSVMRKFQVTPTLPRAMIIGQLPIAAILAINFLGYLHRLIIR